MKVRIAQKTPPTQANIHSEVLLVKGAPTERKTPERQDGTSTTAQTCPCRQEQRFGNPPPSYHVH
jgi:hypothetical protein